MIEFQRKFSKKTKVVFCLISALLLSISWWGASCITLFVGFVPLLFISAQYSPSWRDTFSMLGWATLTFLLWNAMTIWWVWIATPAGPIVASVVSTWWGLVAFMAYHIVSKHAPKAVAYTTFITAWIATEYIYTQAPVMSFPWLTLGNGFADDVWAVQWYEYTGVFGGSLWVLLVNILSLESLLTMSKRVWLATTFAFVIPIGISLILYEVNSPEREGYQSLEEVTVSAIQPNVDCYEKFNIDAQWQQDNLMELLNEVPDSAEFILMPETSLAEHIYTHTSQHSNIVCRIADSLAAKKTSAMVVAGGEAIEWYGRTKKSETARDTGSGQFYDIYNSSFGINAARDVQIHHKGKLVIGVESTPAWLREFKIGEVDLGGTFGQLGIGQKQEPFLHNGKKVAPAICYEGLYGNYMAEFARNGAEALFVVSNDGWWGNTIGHKLLFRYCQLRAVELRREVARSANTGVSGFINLRGESSNTLSWAERGVTTANIRLNKRTTFYASHGDYIGRLALLVAGLCLLYSVALWAKKRFYLN